MNIQIDFFANSGCQYYFYPLSCVDGALTDPTEIMQEEKWVGWVGVRDFANNMASFQEADLRQFEEDFKWQPHEQCKYIRYHLKKKTLMLEHREFEIIGIEVALETTTTYDEDLDRARGVYCGDEVLSSDDRRYNDGGQPASIYHRIAPQGRQQVSGVLGQSGIDFTLELYCRPLRVTKPCMADLVLDIGNSRTVALLLKGSPDGKFTVTPVNLKQDFRGGSLSVDRFRQDIGSSIVSSSLLLHQSEFAEFEDESSPLFLVQERYDKKEIKVGFFGKKKLVNHAVEKRIPAMFMNCSPVLFGDAADACLRQSNVQNNIINKGLNCQQSSPKRYFTECRESDELWFMVPNENTDQAMQFPRLASRVLYFLKDDGSRFEPGGGFSSDNPHRAPKNPCYPRKTTLIWYLLRIFECAWSQLNSNAIGTGTFVQYELRNIIATYPAGWTKDERDAYRGLFEDAVRIFQDLVFGGKGYGSEIKVKMEIDEAVAGQIPYIYSEGHRFNDKYDRWLKIMGKTREDGTGTGVRIMNFDIGGGTTDIAVISYTVDGDEDKNGIAELRPTVLYKDGFTKAGDDLMRDIIKNVIFPAFQAYSNECVDNIKRYFTGSGSADQNVQRSRILRTCIIPLAIAIMRQLTEGAPSGVLQYEEVGVGREDWKNFGRCIGEESGVWEDLELRYEPEQVRELIRNMFSTTFEDCARIAAIFDADLFFMSGKTSELPVFKELAEEHIPLPPNRIIWAKDFRAGDWYPFRDKEGRIMDAKSVTAVGAAWYHLLHASSLPGWQIWDVQYDGTGTCQWGEYKELDDDGEYAAIPFHPDGLSEPKLLYHDFHCGQSFKKKVFMVRLGRISELIKYPEAVYILECDETANPSIGCDASGNPQFRALNVTFRQLFPSDAPGTQGGLEIASAVIAETGEDVTAHCRLFPYQINPTEAQFWQDSGGVIVSE